MRMYSRMLVAGALLLALGVWSIAAEDAAGLRGEVQKVADALGKGDAEQAKKTAAEVAKSSELEEVMSLMQPRRANAKKPVFGVGTKPGAVTPDGIEAKVIALSKKVDPRQLDKESAALAEMALRVQAIAEIATAKAPEKDEGQKKKKDWMEWAGEMKKSAMELGEAAKEKHAPQVKAAAAKLNSACNNCHGVFRD